MNDPPLKRLRTLLGPEDVTQDGDGTTRVTPDSAEAVRLVCRLATEEGWRIRVEGRGSWTPADAPADLVVSTAGLDAVVSVSAADLVATVQAGVPFDLLRHALAEAGMWLALDPPGRAERTVGSVVATATAGPLRTRFGPVRDHLLGCTVVTADGRVVTAGGQVVKNVAGFDLTKLQVGGFGGFGVITEVHLRLRALPRADATLMAQGSRDVLTAAGRDLLAAEVEIAALELLSPAVAAAPEWVLAARVLGTEALVQSEVPRVTGAALPWERLDHDRSATLWNLVAGSALSGPISLRLGVLVDGIDEMIDRLAHDLDEGLITAGAAAGDLRWTGDATVQQLRAFRRTLALQEIPVTLERAPWRLRHAVGHFGAYREGVGRVVDEIRRAFDPRGCLAVALDGTDD